MVNHKKSLESKCIPQWRHQYIEYGDLNDSLSKAVKQVHKLFEAHATIIESQKAKQKQIKKDKEKNLDGLSRRRQSIDAKTQEETHIDHPIIVLDELEGHRKFEKKVFLCFNCPFKIIIVVFLYRN